MRGRRGWQLDPLRVRALVEDMRPVIEGQTGARFTALRRGPCGSEGCIFYARHARYGPVVLKVGYRPYWTMRGDRPDFEAGALMVGSQPLGVVRTYGVWQSRRTKAYALLRERVHQDWCRFRRERSVQAGAFWRAMGRIYLYGVDHAKACRKGSRVVWPRRGLRQEVVAAGFGPVLAGLEAMRRRGICAGADLHEGNLGWRRGPAGRPEVVILDLGFSGPKPGRDAWPRPSLASFR